MIKLYSTGCPMCKALTAMLTLNEIDYEVVSSEEEMAREGITHVPMLDVDGKRYSYPEALKWMKNRGE